MQQLAGPVLDGVINGAPEGVAVCDARAADMPVVYVNPAFERLSGYGATELLGRNLRLLQGTDREQDGCRKLHEAVAKGEGCRVTLRNYRKDGTSFWNEIQLEPLRDADGTLTHYVAYYRDAGGRLKTPERPLEGIPTWLREDRVSGLSSRAWFEELMLRDWATARREQRPITLLLFDIDGLGLYCETFGRSAGDAAIRRIARQISTSFRRGADVVGRWDSGCAAVLAGPVVPAGINEYAQLVAQRVLELHIHNPRALNQKMLTVSTGVATTVPVPGDEDCGRLVRAAEMALRHAQAVGGGKVAVATEADFNLPATPER
jgi:diguanylate cyclase (GGDEF)-like protein/PAS domain S-box-containing protein